MAGFEKMKFVKNITDISVLNEIGIESIAHQQRIMQQIDLLKQKDKATKHEENAEITDIMKRRCHQNVEEVQYWMENVVKLPVHYDTFIKNGYDSLSIIKEVNDVSELAEIGIISTKDQMRIMTEIDELKKENLRILNIYGKRPKEGQIELMRTQEG
eukprot:862298_1